MTRLGIASVLLAVSSRFAAAQLPPPPSENSLGDWSNSFAPTAPGLLAAADLLDAPAGGRGPIVVRGEHFYSGDRRIKFWGVNLAFGANFPTREQADKLAMRLSRFGINAVRLHHMDNQPFPNGIFADRSLTTLSTEALDRLDYLTNALRLRGIWSDINLHVSRNYASLHPETATTKSSIDKIVDLFDPVLIDSQKRYASDLLNHVNAYTHHRYADEPAVAIIEINNENSLFMWDARKRLATLPAPFEAELKSLWNRWLLARYRTRDELANAWSATAEPLGSQMLRAPNFAGDSIPTPWQIETHDGVDFHVSHDRDAAVLDIKHTDDQNWHAQFNQANLKIVAGRPYTVRFVASADHPVTMGVDVSQAHGPWGSLGLAGSVHLTATDRVQSLTFTATQSDDNARLSFIVGGADATIRLSHPMLATGGIVGLAKSEDLASENVATADGLSSATPARSADWSRFLAAIESKYYRDMLDYLHHDLGVKCPVTGTIAFGVTALQAQLPMNFIDAHEYWDHPVFPRRAWDPADWRIANTPMVDSPQKNTLRSLARYRVAGRPFTVTEYNHAAPNEWQAECIPMIASFAAAQDWDGVFLFAYSHSNEFENPIAGDYFNIEGNPLKMSLVPMGARLFLGEAVGPLAPSQPRVVNPDPSAVDVAAIVDPDIFNERRSIAFTAATPPVPGTVASVPRIHWTAGGAGTGRYMVTDEKAVVFAGFAAGSMPVDLGALSIRALQTPFATIVLTAANPAQAIAKSDRLLLTTIARAQNTDMRWNAARTSVGTQWGRPPEQIERVVATVALHGHWSHCHALDPSGNVTGDDCAKLDGDDTILNLGQTTTQGYVIDR